MVKLLWWVDHYMLDLQWNFYDYWIMYSTWAHVGLVGPTHTYHNHLANWHSIQTLFNTHIELGSQAQHSSRILFFKYCSVLWRRWQRGVCTILPSLCSGVCMPFFRSREALHVSNFTLKFSLSYFPFEISKDDDGLIVSCVQHCVTEDRNCDMPIIKVPIYAGSTRQ